MSYNRNNNPTNKATVNPYQVSELQRQRILSDTLDISGLVFNKKLYVYDGYGLSANGIEATANKYKSWAEFQKRMYELKVVQRQLELAYGANEIIEYIYNIGLSYTDDTRIDQNKRYIEACFDKQQLNFFYQQSADFAQWGQDKNVLSLFVKVDFSLDNKLFFFSYNEDLMTLLPLQPGDPLPDDKIIYSMEFFSPIGYDGDGKFNYGVIGLKKIQPYLVASNKQQINTQFSINNPIISRIDRIRLKVSGPFLINALYFWNNLNSIQQLDYRIINGNEIREITVKPYITLNSIKWSSDDIDVLQQAWNVWKYARGVNAFSVYNVKTSDGSITTNNVPGMLNVVSEVLRGGAKNSNGIPGGSFQIIPNNPLAYTPIKDYHPTELDYDGNGEYKVFYYSNRLGARIDDGLTNKEPFDLATELLNGVGQFPLFGFETLDDLKTKILSERTGIPQRVTKEIRRVNGEEEVMEKPNYKGGWGGGLSYVVDWLNWFSTTFGQDNNNYGSPLNNLPRSYNKKVSSWNHNSSNIYRLDASNFLRPDNLAFTKEYFTFISKPMRSDINFAIKQGLGNSYYYDSPKNRQNKARMITHTFMESLDYQRVNPVFPTWLQMSQNNTNNGVKTSFYSCLSPFTLEQWMPSFQPISLPNNNIPMFSFVYPVNTIRGSTSFRTPSVEIPYPVTRWMENDVFLRKFNEREINELNLSNANPELNNKYVIDLFPVENNTTNRRQAISNLTGFLSAIYGGYELEWEFYVGITKVSSITEKAYNRENILRAMKIRPIGSRVVENPSPETKPVISQWIQTSELANNVITNLTLDNPNNFTTNIKSVKAYDVTTRQEYNATIEIITPNIEYNFRWNNLGEGKTYEVVMEWSFNEPGTGEVLLPDEVIYISTSVKGPELISTTITALNSRLLEITLNVELNDAIINEKYAYAVSDKETLPASEFTYLGNNKFLVRWNDTLNALETYNLQFQIYWFKDAYSDIIYNEDIFVTIPTASSGNILYSIEQTLLEDANLARTIGSQIVDINFNPVNGTETNNYNAATRFGAGNYNINFKISDGIITQWENLKSLNVSDPVNNNWRPVILFASSARRINGNREGNMGIYIYGSRDGWATSQIIASSEIPILYDLIYPQVIQSFANDVVLTNDMEYRFKVGILNVPGDVIWLFGQPTQGSAVRSRISIIFQNQVNGKILR